MRIQKAKEEKGPREEKVTMDDASLISVGNCRRNTDRIMAAIKDVGDQVGRIHGMLERHLGEHNGLEKADVQATNQVRRVGVIAGMTMGILSAVGMIVMGMIKVANMIWG